MLSPVQRPIAVPGLPDLQTSNSYFILMAGCFAATACCFLWFAAFALICFCAACLCTDFGDLSPIISLPFDFRFAHRNMFVSPRVNDTVSCIADFVKSQMQLRSFDSAKIRGWRAVERRFSAA